MKSSYWYWNRLRCMSPSEMTYRAGRAAYVRLQSAGLFTASKIPPPDLTQESAPVRLIQSARASVETNPAKNSMSAAITARPNINIAPLYNGVIAEIRSRTPERRESGIRSEANISAQSKNDGGFAGAQARIDDLEIGCDMKPGCDFRLVIDLHALFGALEADQVRYHAILQLDDEISDPERIVRPAGQ